MEVSLEVHKISKCTIYTTAFFNSGDVCWWLVGQVVVNWTNYQGCQFDEHFIHCQTSTDRIIARIISNMCTFPFSPQLGIKT